MGGAAGTDIPISASNATSLAQTLGGNTTIQFGNGVLDNPQSTYVTPTTSATSAQGNADSQTSGGLPTFQPYGAPDYSSAASPPGNNLATDNHIILDVSLIGLGILALVIFATKHVSRA